MPEVRIKKNKWLSRFACKVVMGRSEYGEVTITSRTNLPVLNFEPGDTLEIRIEKFTRWKNSLKAYGINLDCVEKKILSLLSNDSARFLIR